LLRRHLQQQQQQKLTRTSPSPPSFSIPPQDFDGHSKESFNNLHLYSSVYGNRCVQVGAQVLPLPGFPDVYTGNICVLVPGSECINLGQRKNGGDFPAPGAEMASRFSFFNNTIYSTNGSNCTAAGGPFTTMAEFQSEGYESGAASTFISTLPSAATMVQWVAAKLAGPSERIAAAAAHALGGAAS